MDPQETTPANEGDTRPTHRRIARKARLIGKLVRSEFSKVIHSDTQATRGDIKAASLAIDERIAATVSAEELTTTLETLDKIAEALGGRDALPITPHGSFRGDRRGRRGGHPHAHAHSHC